MAGEMLSRLVVELQNATSPLTYSELENVTGNVQIGQTNPLVDVTNYSDASRRYIAGLADGEEIAFECYRTHAGSSVQDTLRSRAVNKINSTLRITITDYTVSPNTTDVYTFSATPINWGGQAPAVGDAAKLLLGFKISGDITIA